MGFLRVIVLWLMIMMGCVACKGIGMLIISFFGLLFDDLTGTNTYWEWSLS